LVLVAANLGVAELIMARSSADRRVLVAAVAVPAIAAVYGYLRLRSVDATAAAAAPVKVGIIQGNQPLLGRHNALGVHLARTAVLREEGVDLVVWSEGASSRADRETSDYGEVRRAYANRLRVPTIVGGLLARVAGGRPVYFNTALMADKDGSIKGRYDKQYLLAFGEYIPLADTVKSIFGVDLYAVSPNSGHFSEGTSLDPLPFGDHRISALICYEDILPGFVNRMVRHADPDLLVNLTNDAWFGDSTEPWIHLALAELRAVEHRRYLIRATNSGVSALIDPVGRVPLHGGTFVEQSLIGVAKFMRQRTVYEILGDWPFRLAALAIFAMAFVRRDRVARLLGRG
jgi:apolipoprotein N-acyltransferase